MSKTFDIRIREQSFSANDQNGSNSRWVNALSSAHLQSVTFCLCRPHSPPPISVKLYARGKPNMHYGMALWPDTGLDHDVQCRFFSEESAGSDSDGSLPAFDDLGDGRWRAHLAMALGTITSGATAGGRGKALPAVSGGVTRSRANEAAVLLKLWRTSALNVYKPSRTWFAASYGLLHAAERIVLNASGESLADYMLLASSGNDRLVAKHNAAVLEKAQQRKSRLFVVGRMRSFSAEKAQILLPVVDYELLPKILARTEQMATLLRGREFLQNLLASKAGNVVMFACIEPSGPDWWKLVSVAAIGTDNALIPVESSYELAFAEYLADCERKFLKPIAVGEIGPQDLRPDFILLDTTERVYCEVWGMNKPEYLATKARKLERYARHRQQLVSWNAYDGESLPALPRKRE